MKKMINSKKFEEIDLKVFNWFDEKELIKSENAPKQFMKVAEELGELSSAIIKKDRDKEIDAFGDLIITILGLSYMRDLDLLSCLETAWNEIKERKGKVIDGSFIKN
jgi:NTP pyrophosphatase (non-canonical NTP hydrolase)